MDLNGMRILQVCDWFDPGFRAGGPITSCVNLARLISGACEVYILTGDRDLGESRPYTGVHVNQWNNWYLGINVKYCTNYQHLRGEILRSNHEIKPQAIYLNSMFSWKTTVLPLLLRHWLDSTRIVIAPRGMLKHSALQHKPLRKKIWLAAMRRLGLHRQIIFHATSVTEEIEIKKIFGNSTTVSILPNVPRSPTPTLSSRGKYPNHLQLAFLGRWHPIKNLLMVLRLLKSQDFNCQFDIIGPMEDAEYTAKCKQAIGELPKNIVVRTHGALPTEETLRILTECHAMILPTEGENFGHAIFEALGVGVPVIISDQTQWRELDSLKAGWDLPLKHPEKFAEALQRVASWDQNHWQEYRVGAHQVATRFIQQHNLRNRYLNLFFGDNPLND